MNKILIVSHAMEIGGAERALIGLLDSIDYEKYDVDLFLCRHSGELLQMIPQNVHILPQNKARFLAIPMKELIRQRKFSILYGRLKSKLLSKMYVKKHKLGNNNQVELTYSHKYTYKYIEKINEEEEYDLAISFLTPHYLVANNVRSKKKIAWIHTDYASIEIDIKTEYDMWKVYNHIISISDSCTTSFIQKFPNLANKIIKIENILIREMVEKQSNAYEVEDMIGTNEVLLLSIGRFSYQKNFDNIPDICRRVLKKGIDVKWFIIGYGLDESLIKSKIKEYQLEDKVVLLGKKDNPYPYIKKCDIYIQPSRYEGKAVTVREAQLLQKPVIITRYATSSDQVHDGLDGVIIDMDNEKCAQGIVDFIKDKGKQEKIIDYLKQHDYSNEFEVKKLYTIIGDNL